MSSFPIRPRLPPAAPRELLLSLTVQLYRQGLFSGKYLGSPSARCLPAGEVEGGEISLFGSSWAVSGKKPAGAALATPSQAHLLAGLAN